MKKPVNIIFLLILLFAIVQVYTLVHEGAHALTAMVFGGEVTKIDVNLFGGNPHVSYSGNFSSLQRALISIAGPVVPVLLWFLIMGFVHKQKPLMQQKIVLLLSFGIFGTLIPNILIPVVYELGGNVAGGDMGKFLANTGMNGFLVAGVVFLVLGLGVWLFSKKIKMVEALKFRFATST